MNLVQALQAAGVTPKTLVVALMADAVRNLALSQTEEPSDAWLRHWLRELTHLAEAPGSDVSHAWGRVCQLDRVLDSESGRRGALVAVIQHLTGRSIESLLRTDPEAAGLPPEQVHLLKAYWEMVYR